ncbi:cAMP-binding domain of CRP or a regulatory subunit of cAMP-dependent protein kinases [Desulfatibacillum alkenivorans DSM 16219]|jgi:CRP-like cAMP-binding protein|uniref:cAMP-binding domain of CRP or a regulatory subunit of cAMP-dependent protein kinases n=1 Tax=Desulfatibacillum alkenivorans DSM 16219 TaxID=1121393 RepID=A0A1M6FLL7_9BACT|nr:cyclic nucleotide-binding domain-containing protein [Desulfatibacillum alkenivorans]SHI98543.1 cAMP-binding domain of CRP or a regulatory subunit of cAMP-dependent protein kinases [Desulfatibacillum alkenivorans DSM 16219]
MTQDDHKFPVMVYHKGQRIFSEGDPGDRVFLVKSGVVCVFRKEEGNRVILAHLKAGQILGETAIITGEPRSASAEAASACQLVAMTSNQMKDALDKSLPFIRALLDQILFRYREMEAKHQAKSAAMTSSLKEVRSLIRTWKEDDRRSANDVAVLLESIDVILQAATKKERYVALVPKGYMQL